MTQLERARALATRAHRYQSRKFGSREPYITHPIAVSEAVHGRDAKAVAMLHDVVEDTPVTLDDLRKDFPEHIVEAVDCLTKRDEELYFDFVRRAKRNRLARRVKMADIKHNMSTLPEGHGLRERYEDALIVLKREVGDEEGDLGSTCRG